MFAKDQGLIQRWNCGERPSTEKENSSRRRSVPAKQSSGCRLKFTQSRPNWAPPARRNHEDTSRIKAQKPIRAGIKNSPRIKRRKPTEEEQRPARQKLLGKKTFQKRKNQQQSMTNFSEISGIQCVNYTSKNRRNYTRKIWHEDGNFRLLHNPQALGKS